jgi:hypothetical protein
MPRTADVTVTLTDLVAELGWAAVVEELSATFGWNAMWAAPGQEAEVRAAADHLAHAAGVLRRLAATDDGVSVPTP